MRQLLAIILTFCIAQVAVADTGTYRIDDYRVGLTPHADGTVDISIQQTWTVTGGHIPWITVGLPNSDFSIDQSQNSGAIQQIRPDNQGSWSGVRIDLDKDYQPGESFTVGFAISQNKLFWGDADNYHLDFTPGWYDRAEITNLTVEVEFFAPIDQVTASPEPDQTSGQQMTWIRSLNRGGRFDVSVAFPRTLATIPEGQLQSKGMSAWMIFLIVVIVGFVVFVLLILFLAMAEGDGLGGSSYRGSSSIYLGTGSRGSSRSTGGGGGFGGRSSGCVFSCVSCACACACAGGGGAGCKAPLTDGLRFTVRPRQKRRRLLPFIGIGMIALVVVLLVACDDNTTIERDPHDAVPEGDPAWPAFGDHWVIDVAGLVTGDTTAEVDAICDSLQYEGLAEVVILVINGVNHPEDYATRYGRHIDLGESGLSSEGGNNGIVWLIRPDVDPSQGKRIYYSVGRGLPGLTSSHLTDIMDAVADPLAFSNFDLAVLTLIKETEQTLRELRGEGG